MIIRLSKGFVNLLGGLAAGLVMATLVLAWVLSRGPVSLSYITPQVSQYLADAFPQVQVDFDNTFLSWEGWKTAVELRVINLRIASRRDEIVATIPQASVVLSPKAMLRGVFAPASLELFDPTLRLAHPTDGQVNLDFAGIGALLSGRLEPLLDQVSEMPSPTTPLSYLKMLSVTNGDVIIADTISDQFWLTPDVQIVLRKDGERVNAEASFLVHTDGLIDGPLADVSIVAGFDRQTSRIDAGISFDKIRPADFGQFVEELGFLQYFDIPVQGTVTLAAAVDGTLESIGFNLTGETGEITLPNPLTGSLKTRNFVLNGYYDAQKDRLEIEELNAQLADHQKITLLTPVSHAYPISEITFSGAYLGSRDTIDIKQMTVNLGGLASQLEGKISDVSSLAKLALSIEIPKFKVSDISVFWPKAVASDAYNWVTSSFLAGNAQNLLTDIEAVITRKGDLKVLRIDGAFEIKDATISYLDSMPPITDISGEAVFNPDKFDFQIASGRTNGLDIKSGSVTMMDLSSNIERAEVRMMVAGPARKAMELIDREPMLLASEMGINPQETGGTVNGELVFDFLLSKTMEWNNVTLRATASVKDINVPDGLFGLDVSAGTLDLTIDNNGMDIVGQLNLNQFPTTISWHQNFHKDAAYFNRYDLTMHLTGIQSFADLGIDIQPFPADMISGDIPLVLTLTQGFDENIKLEAKASLDGLSVSLPVINWHKPVGVSGQAQAVIYIEKGKITEIPEFLLTTDKLEIAGSAHYAEAWEKNAGLLDRIVLDRVIHGRTRLSGILVPGKSGIWDADFTGESLDLAPVWEDLVYSDMLNTGESVLENISVSTQFDRVWLSRGRFLDAMTGAFVRADGVWRTVYITSNLDDNAPLTITMAPSKKQNRRILTAWTSDAGAFLRTFNIYDTMIGGELSLTGHFDDDDEKSPLYGFFNVENYRVIEAPALARLVSIMSLTGIVDALQGDGLAFSKLRIPFRYGEGILELREAVATGASLGFTAAGKVYTQSNAVDISGTMIPVYAVNSLLGNIPLIGGMFSGGETGGGVFAADYYVSGSTDDPKVSVNPLSILAPGFLRNIFGVFESGTSPEGEQTENPLAESPTEPPTEPPAKILQRAPRDN